MNVRKGIGVTIGLILVGGFSAIIALAIIQNQSSSIDYVKDPCQFLVIAHRGASGYIPEHTLGAYAVAAIMGADYLEPDVVMTKDGHLIARHDNELGLTTDVSQHPEFATRYRTQSIDGHNVTGWFTEDFTLEEIKTLRAIERLPTIRPGNTRMDRIFEIPTMQEIIDLTRGLEIGLQRKIGIYPEIKHPTHFQRLGLAMERPLVDLLHNNGYRGKEAPIFIQSFEVNNLKELKSFTDLRLIQLLGENLTQPFDQKEVGASLTYGRMATAEGLHEIATYADAVGPEKHYIIPRNADNTLGEVTSFVQDAHAVALEVHPYTFRSENTYLPVDYQTNDSSLDSTGDAEGEIKAFLAAGIDGLFTDQPDIAIRVKANCDKL